MTNRFAHDPRSAGQVQAVKPRLGAVLVLGELECQTRKMYRLFAAIEIPRDLGEELELISEKVTGANWRPIENYHITLGFFGEMDGNQARDLDHELAQIEMSQFQLMLKGAGWFGANEPHALWAGVERNETLNALAAKCDRAARRSHLTTDKRPYRPHVTLAYCKGTPLEEAARFAEMHARLQLGPFWVDRFHLVSSSLGKGKSRYVSEAEYPLK